MAKRHRARPRQRRPAESTHRAAPPRAERESPRATAATPVTRTSAHRPVRGSRAGYSRAIGAPSGPLERAALVERNFISKDFRRLALVVGIALALLVVSGVLEGIFLK
jgi:hypothetical protein